MYLDPTYTLQEIANMPYLLPFGQGIPLFHRQLRLNQTSAFIWDILKGMENLSEMSLENAGYYAAGQICEKEALPESEKDTVAEDVCAFLMQLRDLGIISEEKRPDWRKDALSLSLFQSGTKPEGHTVSPAFTENPTLKIHIADICINLHGDHALFSKELFSFRISDEGKAPTEELHFYFAPISEHSVLKGAALINSPDLCVYEYTDGYQFLMPSSEKIMEIRLSKDGTSAWFYINGAYDASMKYDVFHAIRFMFSYAAMLRGHFLIHSVSMLYKERAWLFSAPSGTGKSTHSELWIRLYGDEVRILNGDLNLISMTEEIPMVYGIPWNGTSDIYTTEAVPLGGVIFLSRGETDYVKNLSPDEKILSLTRRFISPNWTEDFLMRHIEFAEKLAPKLYLRELFCTKEPSAAKLLRQDIDAYIESADRKAD